MYLRPSAITTTDGRPSFHGWETTCAQVRSFLPDFFAPTSVYPGVSNTQEGDSWRGLLPSLDGARGFPLRLSPSTPALPLAPRPTASCRGGTPVRSSLSWRASKMVRMVRMVRIVDRRNSPTSVVSLLELRARYAQAKMAAKVTRWSRRCFAQYFSEQSF
jgi:hypothetical protein